MCTVWWFFATFSRYFFPFLSICILFPFVFSASLSISSRNENKRDDKNYLWTALQRKKSTFLSWFNHAERLQELSLETYIYRKTLLKEESTKKSQRFSFTKKGMKARSNRDCNLFFASTMRRPSSLHSFFPHKMMWENRAEWNAEPKRASAKDFQKCSLQIIEEWEDRKLIIKNL